MWRYLLVGHKPARLRKYMRNDFAGIAVYFTIRWVAGFADSIARLSA